MFTIIDVDDQIYDEPYNSQHRKPETVIGVVAVFATKQNRRETAVK